MSALPTRQLEGIVKLALERVVARETRCPTGPAASACGCSGGCTCAGAACKCSGGCSCAPGTDAAAKVTATSPKANPGAGSREPTGAMSPVAAPAPLRSTARGEVAVGSDHGGFELKRELVAYLRDVGYRVRDLGTHSTEAVDYPDYALAVAAAVAKGDAWRGIMVDGVGVGSGMAANKVPGIRAAVCFDVFSTRNAREHNDANVMCVGGRVLEPAKAREMARLFLETDFGGDRHARRVEKVMKVERMFLDAARGK